MDTAGGAHPGASELPAWGEPPVMLLPPTHLLRPTRTSLPHTGELNETECDKQTCECDRSVVLCLRNQTYNEKHRNYLNIYCQGPTPNCSIYEPPPEEVA